MPLIVSNCGVTRTFPQWKYTSKSFGSRTRYSLKQTVLSWMSHASSQIRSCHWHKASKYFTIRVIPSFVAVENFIANTERKTISSAIGAIKPIIAEVRMFCCSKCANIHKEYKSQCKIHLRISMKSAWTNWFILGSLTHLDAGTYACIHTSHTQRFM